MLDPKVCVSYGHSEKPFSFVGMITFSRMHRTLLLNRQMKFNSAKVLLSHHCKRNFRLHRIKVAIFLQQHAYFKAQLSQQTTWNTL